MTRPSTVLLVLTRACGLSRSPRIAVRQCWRSHHSANVTQRANYGTLNSTPQVPSSCFAVRSSNQAAQLLRGLGAAVQQQRWFCAKSPPPDWYKRGAWIDASEIEKHMVDDSSSSPTGEHQPPSKAKEPETLLTRQIKASIKFRGGPITVAEYMKEVLTNPLAGFYAATGGEAIGRRGHFITSPEVSSLFGEMLGVWIFKMYEDMGHPARFSLVELGPGKGTLMRQMLTAVKSIPGHERFISALQVHLVEVSPELRMMQHDALGCTQARSYGQVHASAPHSIESGKVGEGDQSSEAAQGTGSGQLSEGMQVRRPNDTDTAPESSRANQVGDEARSDAPSLSSTSARSDRGGDASDSPPTAVVSVGRGRKPPRGAVVQRAKAAAASLPEAAPDNYSAALAAVGSGMSRLDVALMRSQDTLVQARSGLAGCDVCWHYSYDEVPDTMPTIVIGHEFLDALPVHQFVKDEKRGWLEVLVNECQDTSNPRHLEFVLSPYETIAVRTILRRRLEGLADRERLRAVEVSPQAMALVESVAGRISRRGGAALFIDYGKNGPYENSLNAIRGHAPVHVLEEPGKADVTAWVDFDALRQAVDTSSADASVHGPLTQGHFLLGMGMEQRLDMLLQGHWTDEERERLESNFAMLVAGPEYHPQGMGESFKAMAITPSRAPAPFPFYLDFAAMQKQ